MFDGFFSGIAWLLNFFYELAPNYAIAIALLTMTVMLITTPITLKGTKSMLQMQTLQPEMRRIQQKYKDDRQKQNEELMKFYSENGINPLGGCLPLLLQAPIFLILFQLIQGLTRKGDGGGFDPKHLDEGSKLYRDLVGDTEMTSFGVDLSRSASSAIGDGFGTAFPYLILIAIVAATSFYQQRQVTKRNPNAGQAPGAALMKFLPLITVVFSYSFPAALVVYFVTSNVYRVGQQAYITKSLYGDDESPGRKAQAAAAKVRAEKGDDDGAERRGKGYTPPKGEATPSRDEAREKAAKTRQKQSNRSKKKKKRR